MPLPDKLLRPSLKLNALSNFAALAVNVAVGFFLTPAMLVYLGEKRFGIWALVSSLVGYYGLLDFGVGSAVFRYVPLFRGQGNHHRVSAVISTSLVFYGTLSLLIILLTQLLGQPVSRFFDGGADLATLLRIVGIAAALGMPAIVLSTSAASYESFAPANFVSASTQLLRAALLYGCMFAGFGIAAMGWALVLVSFSSLVGNSVVFKQACKDVRIRLSAVNWVDLKMLLSFGSVMLIVGVANSLATESPKQVVAKIISLEALGLFAIVLQLILYYRMLIISLTKVFSPRFSFLAGSQDAGEIRRLFIQGCRYMTIIAGGVAILLWITGAPFLLLWTSKPEILKAMPALAIMVAGTFVFLSHRLGGDLLFGLGKQKQVALLELLEAAGIVGLTILFSIRFGVAGAGLGLALPPLLVRGVLQTRFVGQAIGLGFFEYYSRCLLGTWLVVAAIAGVGWWLPVRQQITGWPSLVLVSALLLIVYAICIFAFVLEDHEKAHFKDEFTRLCDRWRRFRAAFGGAKS